MAITVEALQHLVREMHKMQSVNIANLMKQQHEALAVLFGGGRGNSGLTDAQGIGRPVAFTGEVVKYAEYKSKLMAYLRISSPQADELKSGVLGWIRQLRRRTWTSPIRSTSRTCWQSRVDAANHVTKLKGKNCVAWLGLAVCLGPDVVAFESANVDGGFTRGAVSESDADLLAVAEYSLVSLRAFVARGLIFVDLDFCMLPLTRMRISLELPMMVFMEGRNCRSKRGNRCRRAT